MATMVVLAFKDETGAEQMRDTLVGLQKLQLISLSDAAVVVRRQDGKVKVKQATLKHGLLLLADCLEPPGMTKLFPCAETLSTS